MTLELKAKSGCCEEAALGLPFYAPCDRPALSIVGWKGRSDAPIRMCAACADHNVRNRGGYVIKPFAAEDPLAAVAYCTFCKKEHPGGAFCMGHHP